MEVRNVNILTRKRLVDLELQVVKLVCLEHIYFLKYIPYNVGYEKSKFPFHCQIASVLYCFHQAPVKMYKILKNCLLKRLFFCHLLTVASVLKPVLSQSYSCHFQFNGRHAQIYNMACTDNMVNQNHTLDLAYSFSSLWCSMFGGLASKNCIQYYYTYSVPRVGRKLLLLDRGAVRDLIRSFWFWTAV